MAKKNRKIKQTGAQESFNAGPEDMRKRSEDASQKANQEFFSRHENEDERETEYSSQREESRARRKHRQHQSRQRTRDTFRQSDGEFNDKASFMNDAGAESTDSHRNKKLGRLEEKATKAASKTERARKRLPQQKEYKLVRHFDETTGKVSYELETWKVPKKSRRKNSIEAAGQRVAMEGSGFVHQKISEHEKENSGVEAAHKAEQAAENVASRVIQRKPDIYGFRRSRVAALEKKQFKAETNFRYQKFLEDNPEIK